MLIPLNGIQSLIGFTFHVNITRQLGINELLYEAMDG